MAVVAPYAVKRLPWRTLALTASLIAAYCVIGAAELLVYDRSAIQRGEWWRLLSGHWVHFSDAHLLCNVAVVAAAGWLIETRRRGDILVLLALTILVVGPVLLLSEPGLATFGGASGIAYALVAYVALCGLTDAGRWRLICSILLALLGLKVLVEWEAGWSLSAGLSTGDFVPVPLSHLVGVGAALGFWLWGERRRLRAGFYGRAVPTDLS